jgi:hypothetical protein
MAPSDREIRHWQGVAQRQGLTAEELRSVMLQEMDEEEVAVIWPLVQAGLPPAQPRASRPEGRKRERHGGRADGAPQSGRPQSPPAAPTSPYRFITLNERVLSAPEAVRTAALDLPLPGGFSGTIALVWEAETPLLIGSAQGTGTNEEVVPLRHGNTPVIPGATLKGLLRTGIEIVTLGRLSQLNARHRFGIRDFDDWYYSDDGHGQSRLAWDKLETGWLQRVPASEDERARGLSDYLVTPCDKRTIRIRDLPFLSGVSEGQRHATWLGMTLARKYGHAGMLAGAAFDFAPAPPRRFTRVADGQDVKPAEAGEVGVYVFSGPLSVLPRNPTDEDIERLAAELDRQDREPAKGNRKKREYVFLDRPGEQPVRVPQAVFDSFHLIHSAPSGRGWSPTGSWAVLRPTLVEHGRRIPVFILGDIRSGRFDMGLTRSFKVAHAASVGDVLERTGGGVHRWRPEVEPDWAEALFGHVFEPEADTAGAALPPRDFARRGRVAVGFAHAETPSTLFPPCGQCAIRTTMMGPRASFAPHYVTGPEKHWSAPDARLAGRKGYFPRFQGGTPAEAQDLLRADRTRPQQGGGDGTVSRLRFLVPATGARTIRFRSELRLHNLLAEEVGALLWVLTHGGDGTLRHMLGRGRPFGAGQMRLDSADLAGLEGHDAAAGEILAGGQPAFLAAFTAAMEKAVRAAGLAGGWAAQLQVREWLGLADPAWGGGERQAAQARYPGSVPSADGMDTTGGPKAHRDLRKAVSPRKAAGRDRWLPTPARPPRRG